jgi:hypothetical protein
LTADGISEMEEEGRLGRWGRCRGKRDGREMIQIICLLDLSD